MKSISVLFAVGVAVVAMGAIAPVPHASPCTPLFVRPTGIFTVLLDSNESTGYKWVLEDPLNSAVVSLVNASYERPGTDMAGASGKQVWILKGVRPGKTIVSLKYVRPWEKNAAPAREAFFIIVVR